VLCTCDVVHALCNVQVVLCTCCTYGTGVRVVLCACHTCCVEGMWYYVCALCSHGIVTCVFVVLYFVYVYELCCTSRISEFIMWWCTPDVGICLVLHCTLGVGVCIVCQV